MREPLPSEMNDINVFTLCPLQDAAAPLFDKWPYFFIDKSEEDVDDSELFIIDRNGICIHNTDYSMDADCMKKNSCFFFFFQKKYF